MTANELADRTRQCFDKFDEDASGVRLCVRVRAACVCTRDVARYR